MTTGHTAILINLLECWRKNIYNMKGASHKCLCDAFILLQTKVTGDNDMESIIKITEFQKTIEKETVLKLMDCKEDSPIYEERYKREVF